ncbi:MAG: response regulator transcription factor [Bacteroidales bacterium]|nr:response regulator transcription factor [Bacteroidales bacterium]
MTTTINTLVVDDEPLALDLVRSYVEQTPYLTLVDSYDNAKAAFDRIQQGGIDLIFLDIQMPGLSGLTLIKSLQGQNAPKVIFTTAFDKYAIDGFKLSAVDYLLKPFDLDEFLAAAAKARNLIELERTAANNVNAPQQPVQEPAQEEGYFFVKSEYKLVRINIPNILYIEGLKDYIKIYLEGQPKPVLTIYTMKDIEARLPSPQFQRVHRSFIINIYYVRGIDRNLILLSGDTKVPMGDSYRQNFLDVINHKTI